jgi:hypothetical protein
MGIFYERGRPGMTATCLPCAKILVMWLTYTTASGPSSGSNLGVFLFPRALQEGRNYRSDWRKPLRSLSPLGKALKSELDASFLQLEEAHGAPGIHS